MLIFARAAGKRIRQRCATPPVSGRRRGAIWRSPNGRRRAGRRTMHFSSGHDASLSSRRNGKTRMSQPPLIRRSATRVGFGSRAEARLSAARGLRPIEHSFLVPFVFSANGRPYLKQLETQSGIWFRDARKPSHHRRALVDWPTPEGLQGLLEIDAEAAQADLKTRPIEFAFPLRPYQKRAIQTVETELATGRRAMLLAMATGTGKTKTRHRLALPAPGREALPTSVFCRGPKRAWGPGCRRIRDNADCERQDFRRHFWPQGTGYRPA